jgi:asparagine synthase (glutamine-hydrolysing)
MGDMDTSMYLLFRAIRQHSTVALSGESADEVFGGYSWFHDAQAIAAPTFPWHAPALRLFGSLQHAFTPGLVRRLDVKDYIRARYEEALAEVPRLDGETGLERRMREVFYLHLTRFLQILLDRKDRTSMATGLEVRVPFCDHRLVEYLFNVPWAMKTFDGREKSLLRAAAVDLLPKSVLERRKSPYPSTKDPEYTRLLHQQFAGFLEKTDAPVRPLLDEEPLRRLMQEPVEHAPPETRPYMEQVLMFNAWLEDYGVRQMSPFAKRPGTRPVGSWESAGEPMPG